MAIELLGMAACLVSPFLRSAAGWLENAARDGLITKDEWLKLLESFDWRKALETVFRAGYPALAAYLGLNRLGLDFDGLAAGSAAALMDYGLSAYRKLRRR